MSLGTGAIKLVKLGNAVAQEVSMATLQAVTTRHCSHWTAQWNTLYLHVPTNTCWAQMMRGKGGVGWLARE